MGAKKIITQNIKRKREPGQGLSKVCELACAGKGKPYELHCSKKAEPRKHDRHVSELHSSARMRRAERLRGSERIYAAAREGGREAQQKNHPDVQSHIFPSKDETAIRY